jgi:phytoene dehydrogenase-like protein
MATSFGGEILVDAVVKRIIVKDGRAVGVELADGRTFKATKMVVSNVDIGTTVRLAGEENFGSAIVKKVNALKAQAWGRFDLHIASNEPPNYSGVDDPAINRSLNVFVGYEGIDDIDRHTDEARKNEFPRKPSFHAGCQTLYDPSLAPPGKHTLWEWMYVSPQLSMETTESIAEYTETVLARWREFAPNLGGDALVDAYPYYLRKWRARFLVPSISNGQYYDKRPTAELSGYRTPIKGLYLCHSSSHPGGTVRFGPCYNALTVIAKDFGISKWWSDPVPGIPLASE